MNLSDIYGQISLKSAELATLYLKVERLSGVPCPIKKAVHKAAELWQINPSAIQSKTRTDSVCMARWTSFTLLRDHELWPFEAIAKAFGCDHGTVMHGIKTLQERARQCPKIREKLKLAGIAWQ